MKLVLSSLILEWVITIIKNVIIIIIYFFLIKVCLKKYKTSKMSDTKVCYPTLTGVQGVRSMMGQAEGAQRSGESAATDLLTPSPLDTVYFFTYFPYPKYEGISKLYDKIKKKFRKLFLVRELTKEKKVHYHGIGLSENDNVSFELKGYCQHPWFTKVQDGLLAEVPIRSMYENITPEIIVAEDLDPFDYDPAVIEQTFANDKKLAYVKKYLSKKAQIDSMIKYMCKENPKVMYQDYILK